MSDQVKCDTHEFGKETWVCEHLLDNPNQEWFSSPITDENPWPDAWCKLCDQEYLKYGEWNDSNAESINIKLLCHQCYELKRSQEIQ